jgi:hypothetical protein
VSQVSALRPAHRFSRPRLRDQAALTSPLQQRSGILHWATKAKKSGLDRRIERFIGGHQSTQSLRQPAFLKMADSSSLPRFSQMSPESIEGSPRTPRTWKHWTDEERALLKHHRHLNSHLSWNEFAKVCRSVWMYFSHLNLTYCSVLIQRSETNGYHS